MRSASKGGRITIRADKRFFSSNRFPVGRCVLTNISRIYKYLIKIEED